MGDWKRGDEITARDLNAIEAAGVERLRIGPGIVSSRTGGNLTVGLGDHSPVLAAPAEVRRFKVTAVADNYLTCCLRDGDGTDFTSATEYVAKPKALRKAGDTTYQVNDEVLAVRPVWGGTGLSVSSVPITWEVISPGAYGTGGGGGGGGISPSTVTLASDTTFADDDTILTIAAGSAKCVCAKIQGHAISPGTGIWFGLYADATRLASGMIPGTGTGEIAFPPFAIPGGTTNVLIKVKDYYGAAIAGDTVLPGCTYLTVF